MIRGRNSLKRNNDNKNIERFEEEVLPPQYKHTYKFQKKTHTENIFILLFSNNCSTEHNNDQLFEL